VDGPEAILWWSEITTYVSHQRALSEVYNGAADVFENPICRIEVILGNAVPDLPEIFAGQRREDIGTHFAFDLSSWLLVRSSSNTCSPGMP
jgi:hypothetical protein